MRRRTLPGFAEGTGPNVAHIGTFAINGNVTENRGDTINTGTLGWSFTLSDTDPVLQSLAAGQTITQVYTVTIKDNNNATVTQDVTVTITGSNAGNDTITGDGNSNTLEGGPGNDVLDGGAGIDTASYEHAPSGVTVSLALQGTSQNTIGAGFDTLTNFEALRGSAFDDTLTGNGNSTLEGGPGNDHLIGQAEVPIPRAISTRRRV